MTESRGVELFRVWKSLVSVIQSHEKSKLGHYKDSRMIPERGDLFPSAFLTFATASSSGNSHNSAT